MIQSQPSLGSNTSPDDPRSFYTVNTCDESGWSELLDGFDDASVFQTVPFCSAKARRSRVERFVLSMGTEVRAAALVRVTALPWAGMGCAYVRWGPLWRRKGANQDPSVWKEAIVALRTEYVTRRRMWLRLLPSEVSADQSLLQTILGMEGFSAVPGKRRSRTMIIDLRPPLESLRKGLDRKWRNHLGSAEKNGLLVVHGAEDSFFEEFLVPFQEMHARKGLRELGDIKGFRNIQKLLSAAHKMTVFLCYLGEQICAGAVISTLGKRAIYHFGATGDKGMETKASYLLQWRIIEWLKQRNCTEYDLHGVNQQANPGVYSFKAGLCARNGNEVEFLGAYDAYGSKRGRLLSRWADLLQGDAVRNLLARWR